MGRSGIMLGIMDMRMRLGPVASDYGIKRLYLFGSFAKGTATEESDVDLLVEKGRPLSLVKLSGLRQRCEEVLERPVDIVTTSGIAEDFQNEIAGTEILLYEE